MGTAKLTVRLDKSYGDNGAGSKGLSFDVGDYGDPVRVSFSLDWGQVMIFNDQYTRCMGDYHKAVAEASKQAAKVQIPTFKAEEAAAE